MSEPPIWKKALSEMEVRLITFEVTRLKNGGCRCVLVEISANGSIQVLPLVKAA